MASGMPSQPGLIGRLMNTISGKVGGRDAGAEPNDRIARMGLSERQQTLNRLWSWYRAQQYEARTIDWNGRTYMTPLAVEAISSRGFIPPGFVDAGGQNTPLKFRRPSAPYSLARVITDRFTGLLFSEGQYPEVHVDGDPVTEDFMRTVIDVSRLWQQMLLARAYGGGMGSVAVGFQFVDGKPIVEVHDPRWCEPQFVERSNFVLKQIEKRYQFPQEERDPATGKYETVWYWYRRIIDAQSDTVFQPVEVGNGDEPNWQVQASITHGLGFCPVVWVQNLPVQDEVDGDPDCHGAYDLMEGIDQLLAQAHRAVLANCDPTLVIETDSEMPPEIQKGSGNAIKVPKGSAKYLEMTASGSKAAMDMVDSMRDIVLEVCQCVLEHTDVQHNRTATEVDRNFATMLAKADVMREQYGTRCVKPLLEMIFKAAEMLGKPQPMAMPAEQEQPQEPQEQLASDENGPITAGSGAQAQGGGAEGAAPPAAPGGEVSPVQSPAQQMVRAELNLPPAYTEDPNTGEMQESPRSLGTGGTIRLRWPSYFKPSLQDVLTAAQAVVAVKTAGLLDSATAAKFLARFFDVEDAGKMLASAQKEFQQEQSQMMAGSLSSPGAANPGG